MARDNYKMYTSFRTPPINAYNYKQPVRYGGVGGYGGLSDIVHNMHFLWARGLCPPTIVESFPSFTTADTSEQTNPDLVYLVRCQGDLQRHRLQIRGSSIESVRVRTKYGGADFTRVSSDTDVCAYIDNVTLDRTKDNPVTEYDVVKIWFWRPSGSGTTYVYSILGEYSGESHIYNTTDLTYDTDFIPIDERQCGITDNAVDVETINTISNNLLTLQEVRTPMIYSYCDPNQAVDRISITTATGYYQRNTRGGYHFIRRIPVRPIPGCKKVKVWVWAHKVSGTANYIWARSSYDNLGWEAQVTSTAAYSSAEPDGLYDGSGDTLDVSDSNVNYIELFGQSDGELNIHGIYIWYCNREL